MSSDAFSSIVHAIQQSVVPPTVNVGERIFATSELKRIPKIQWEPVNIKTLTGLIDYVGFCEYEDSLKLTSLFVHVSSHSVVHLKTELNGDQDRETVVTAKFESPVSLALADGVELEKAIVSIQTQFAPNPDREKLLQFLGTVEYKNIQTSVDDGVSQATQVKTGFGTVQDKVVPSPCQLIPYKTFPEIEQPTVPYIVRLNVPRGNDVPFVRLIECGGEAWKSATMLAIKEYLTEHLPDDFCVVA